MGDADGLGSGEEEADCSEDGHREGHYVCLAPAGHLVYAEEADRQGGEEGEDEAGEGEDAEEDVGADEGDEECRQEEEGQVVCQAGPGDGPFHVVDPVSQVKSEEPRQDEGAHDDRIPAVGQAPPVLSDPPEEGAQEEDYHAGNAVVEGFRDELGRSEGHHHEDGRKDRIGGKLRGRHSPVCRHFTVNADEHFRNEAAQEDSERGEGVDEEAQDDQHEGDRYAPPFEEAELLEIEPLILGVGGEAHEGEVGHHDACRFKRPAADVEQGAENENGRIRSGEAGYDGAEYADVQKRDDSRHKIQGFHLLKTKDRTPFCGVSLYI